MRAEAVEGLVEVEMNARHEMNESSQPFSGRRVVDGRSTIAADVHLGHIQLDQTRLTEAQVGQKWIG